MYEDGPTSWAYSIHVVLRLTIKYHQNTCGCKHAVGMSHRAMPCCASHTCQHREMPTLGLKHRQPLLEK